MFRDVTGPVHAYTHASQGCWMLYCRLEDGGSYDSVPPPAATPPDDGSPSTYNQWGFTFGQLGVRVPAVVVSP
jgi:hypothetical protein